MRSLCAMTILLAATAQAHFVLDAPASYWTQDGYGDPEKAPPCGYDGSGSATGLVTPFHPGDTVTITITEAIFHRGHYRVALATGLWPDGGLKVPDEPAVTAGATPCGSAVIDPHPAFPVLADGQLVHTSAFAGPQSFQVTLPSNVTCAKCTLQVIEFMADHGLNVPGGCFYHHCADVSILPATDGGSDAGTDGGSPRVDAGQSATDGGSGAGGGGGSASSGCTTLGAMPASLLALGAWLLFRRYRS